MRQRLSAILVLSMASFAGGACSSDPSGSGVGVDDNPGGTAGASGTAGSGGPAGRAGSSGTVGGGAGSSGSAGSSGGTAGSSGSAGSSGNSGGNGGTGASGVGGAAGSGAGGTGGTAGAGGSSGGAGGRGGSGGSGGSGGRGGSGGGGTGGRGGAGGGTTDARPADGPTVDAGAGDTAGLARFSFFYTSLEAMRKLSGSQNGFGGDLRFGEQTGLAGADKICQTIAAGVGHGAKTWRAFLSVTKGPDGQPVHAIDRVGEGPWYDRNGRLIAMNKAGLISGNRPAGDPQAVNDLPDETGQGTRRLGDTHDVITGSNSQGRLRSTTFANTCNDWTTTTTMGRVQVGMGHSWPAGSGMHWIQAHYEPSCAAGVNLVQNGPGNGSSIGAGGGWGGFYCFALQP